MWSCSGQDLSEDQCIFIRGLHATRRLKILPLRLKAAAGPSPEPEEHDEEPDAELFFIYIHFRAPWGTGPYVALPECKLYVSVRICLRLRSLPFQLWPPHSQKEVDMRRVKCRNYRSTGVCLGVVGCPTRPSCLALRACWPFVLLVLRASLAVLFEGFFIS